MDPFIIALICAASFGALVALASFVRQIMLSRDKRLNDEAQRIALAQEVFELERMRAEMQNNKRFDTHYVVLGNNKEAIFYLDSKIDELFKKKSELVNRYAKLSLKESGAIVSGESSSSRKASCDMIRQDIDEKIRFYNKDLEALQQRRASLWDTHADIQERLLDQEKKRNEHLDKIYSKHSGLLEKVYLRHIEDTETVAKYTIDAGTASFSTIVMAPMQFLRQYFGLGTGINLSHTTVQQVARNEVLQAQANINGPEPLVSQNQKRESHDDSDDESEESETRSLVA